MNVVRARCGACRSAAAHVLGALATRQQILESLLNEGPATHVLRVLLRPDEFIRIRILREDFTQTLRWEWIELFHAYDRDVPFFSLLSCLGKIVVNLATA